MQFCVRISKSSFCSESFHSCPSHEQIGKAVGNYPGRGINFKLPQSLLSDSRAPTWISSLSTSSSERNHQSCLCVTRVAPSEPLPVPPSDRTCLGRRIRSQLLHHPGPHLCQLSNLWMHFFPALQREMHRTFGNNSISFKGTHLGKLLFMHLSKRCSTLTNISCNYSKDETVTTSDHQSFPRSIITMEHTIKPNQHPVIKEQGFSSLLSGSQSLERIGTESSRQHTIQKSISKDGLQNLADLSQIH